MEKEWISDEMDGTKDDWVRVASGNGILHEIYLPESGGAGLPAIQNSLAYSDGFLGDAWGNGLVYWSYGLGL